MPRCEGHDSGLGWKCTVCGKVLSYRDACGELLRLPSVEPKYPRVAALFAGLPARDAPGFSTLTLTSGERESLSRNAFSVARTNGSGSWSDFHRAYRKRLEEWFGAVGFSSATYRMLVVDATDPLSVLAVSAVPSAGTVVFAVIADSASTPIQQNTSYVALRAATNRGLPVILCSKAHASEAAYFAEGEGFQVGERAVARVVDLIASSVEDVAQFLADDVRLGVNLHCFSAILSASDVVYRSLDDALTVQANATSLDVYLDEVQTSFLAAFASAASEQEVERSFTKYRVRELKKVITAEHKVYPRAGDQRLFDLLSLFGLREGEVLPTLADGYRRVAERVPDLGVEKLG